MIIAYLFQECFKFVLPAISHAVDLLKGHKQQVTDTHRVVQAGEGLSKVRLTLIYRLQIIFLHISSKNMGTITCNAGLTEIMLKDTCKTFQ